MAVWQDPDLIISGEEKEEEEGDRRDKIKRVKPDTSVTLT